MGGYRVLNIATETGKLLLLGGAESFRIKETVKCIGKPMTATLNC